MHMKHSFQSISTHVFKSSATEVRQVTEAAKPFRKPSSWFLFLNLGSILWAFERAERGLEARFCLRQAVTVWRERLLGLSHESSEQCP